MVARRDHEGDGVARWRITRQRLIRRRLMMRAGLSAGANHGEAIVALGKHGDMFAEEDAREPGANDAELAANAVGRVGLGIECFVLARRAPTEDQDARVGQRAAVGGCFARRSNSGSPRPATPNGPTRSNSRRESGVQRGMATPREDYFLTIPAAESDTMRKLEVRNVDHENAKGRSQKEISISWFRLLMIASISP